MGFTKPEWEITPDVLSEAERLATLALTEGQISAALGIHQTTLISKKKMYPEFNAAIKRGFAKALEKITNGFMVNALNETEAEPGGNLKAQMFFLSRKAGWIEPQTVTLEGNPDRPLFIAPLVATTQAKVMDGFKKIDE